MKPRKNIQKSKTSAVAIIQARMGSTRLPGKALLPLGGRPLLYHVFERARAVSGIDRVVLATSIGSENKPLIQLAEEMNIDVFVGSIDNVLERYFLASEEFNGSWIMRITGDNPFTDPEYASLALQKAIELNADLTAISGLPLGTAVEIIKKTALDKAYHEASQDHEREHVSPYIKEHPELFTVTRVPLTIDNPFAELRLTIDTPEDYAMAQIIFNDIYKETLFNLSTVIEYLKKNPRVVKLNSSIQQRPMTHSSNKSGNEPGDR